MINHDWYGPRILSQGFRPFFLLAGLSAVIMIAVWVFWLSGYFDLALAYPPVVWHAHEMLFGMAGAALAGFLLTAIPNWTGRLPLRGWPLAALVLIWIAGRIAMSMDSSSWDVARAGVDVLFLFTLLTIVLREIVHGRNWRNLPIVAAVGVLMIANITVHAETLGYLDNRGVGLRLGIAVFVVLIALIGGRIIPSFTGNWLAKQSVSDRPRPFGGFDRLGLLVTAASLMSWSFLPDTVEVGIGLIAAGILNVVRLLTWKGHLTFREPLVWSLHLAFLWLPIGLIALGASAASSAVTPDIGLHALTAGAIGGMIAAVMTRAILGHTGRDLTVDRVTTAIYVLIFMAASLRVIAPSISGYYTELLMASSIAWCGAFLIFCARFGVYLVGR